MIGASLGGLSAVSRVLSALPPGYALPVALAQHRVEVTEDVDGLARYLGGMCMLPVKEAEDKDEFAAGRVLVAPAGYHMLIEDGSVALSTEAAVSYARPSVDVLFESAAQAYGSGVLAVVLTGSSRDGAAGAEAVRGAGGQVLVQDPETAESQAMPRAAMAAAKPQAILTLDEIGELLGGLVPARARGGR